RAPEALQVLDAAQSLEHGVVARPVAVRAVGAERGHGTVDEARVHLAKRGRVHAEPRLHAGPHVLEEDIRRLHEAVENLAARGLLQVDGDRALAAVPTVEAR